MSYRDFFAAVTQKPDGPFEYQKRLAEHAWPDVLNVPTGLGKTAAVIVAWLYKRLMAVDATTPRRLVYCLPMRVLVEQTETNAREWAERATAVSGKPAPGVYVLMGGSEDLKKPVWAEHPEHEQILIGTQDMLLSAALNRAYATYPSQWPVHFGLLNVDTFWVMDEVQLMGPGRTTSVQLQHFFEQLGVCARQQKEIPSGRRTLWMSATLGQTGSAMPNWAATPEVKKANRNFALYSPQRNELDTTRLDAPKSLQNKPDWTYESDDLHHTIIDEACQSDDRLVLVFVNTVRRARELHRKLQDKINQSSCATGQRPELILIHSRFRKKDRDALTAKLDQSFGRRIVVSTQVLEAGVDLDADVLFTEIAPWASLIQRFGRLNRRGQKQHAQAFVFQIPQKSSNGVQGKNKKKSKGRDSQDDTAPYDDKAIKEACEFAEKICNNFNGSLSPATLQQVPAPLALEGPILREFILTGDLFPTDVDLSGGHTDVSTYLRALDRDVDCHVLWRELPDGKTQNALPPDEQPPIHRDELCPVPFFEAAKEAFNGKRVWILAYSLEGRRRRATWRETWASDIKPGDTVMVPLEYGCYSDESGWLGKDGSTSQPKRWISVGQDGNGRAARGWKDSQGGFTVIDHHVDPERGFGGDPRSTWKRWQRDWMTLSDHLQKAYSAAQGLVRALALGGGTANAVIEADLWHDLGKALERQKDGKSIQVFQEMLRREGIANPPHPQPSVLYAKSKPKPGGGHSGGGTANQDDEDRFRHEVASALAYLMHATSSNPSDPLKTSLTAYLILAHHGKVRCMPAPWDEERSDDWNGVRPGDRIARFQIPQTSLQWTTQDALDLSLFLSAAGRPGWQGRVALLLEHYGPFYLAYLEALVRIADWRAS